MKDLIASCRKQ